MGRAGLLVEFQASLRDASSHGDIDPPVELAGYYQRFLRDPFFAPGSELDLHGLGLVQ